MTFLKNQIKLSEAIGDVELPDGPQYDRTPWTVLFEDGLEETIESLGLEGEKWDIDELEPVIPRTV